MKHLLCQQMFKIEDICFNHLRRSQQFLFYFKPSTFKKFNSTKSFQWSALVKSYIQKPILDANFSL
jgi:hypothetical protein